MITSREARHAAEEWLGEEVGRLPELVGAILAGSTRTRAPEELHPPSSDVDLFIYVDADVPSETLESHGRFAPRKLAFRGVVLELSFHEAQRLADPEAVLGDMHLAPLFNDTCTLLDLRPVSTGMFDRFGELAAVNNIAAFERSSDTLQFADTNAAHFAHCFYRTPANQLSTPVPAPTGPYAVGTFLMLMTDPARTNTAGGTNCQFMTTFWYPAVPHAGALPAIYVEPQIALSGYCNFTPGGTDFSSQVRAFYSHSLSNAPLATSQIKCPVVLYDPEREGGEKQSCEISAAPSQAQRLRLHSTGAADCGRRGYRGLGWTWRRIRSHFRSPGR